MTGDMGPRSEVVTGFYKVFNDKGLGSISSGQANQKRQAPTTAQANA